MGLFGIFDEACACGEVINLDAEGAEYYAIVVKQSFTWDTAGRAHPIAPQPVIETDVYDGAPGRSSVLLESELVPSKPRVDVLLAGELALSVPVERAIVRLEVGSDVCKTAVVFGDRVWLPSGVRGLRPSAPRTFQRMPITWSRSFGGAHPDAPGRLERRNPTGVGYVPRESKPVANFENPDDPSVPIGFGPVGRSWPSRIRWGGTYDDRWLDERFPLLPHDFDARYFNCAPEDQQVDVYRPGDFVRLQGMTPDGTTGFNLPAFAVPVSVREHGGRVVEWLPAPDTLLIEPAARRFSVTGRLLHYPRPNVLGIEDVWVGAPPLGWLRARSERKRYVGRLPRRTGP